jgi:hypothetical protein
MATLLKELQLIEPALRELQEKRPSSTSSKYTEWSEYRSRLSGTAHVALCDFGRFRGSENLMITMGNGAASIKPVYFINRLLDVTAERGALFAVSALKRLFAAERAKIKSQCLVWGVEVPKPFKLAQNLDIAPLPADPMPAILQGEISRFPRHLQNKSWFSILSSEFVVSSVVVEPAETRELDIPAVEVHKRFMDAVAILCACGPGPVKLEQSWSEFTDPKLAEITPIRGPALFLQEVIPLVISQPVKISDSVRRDVQRYLNLTQEVKDRLRGPLDRLNTGMCKRSLIDQAIDCGIALEMLLGDEMTTEIQYRLALRAALFLGNTLSERQKIRKEVKDLYGLRSKGVHGSRNPIKVKGGKEVVEAGLAACSSAIRKIVKQGTFPNWANLELGS